MNLMESTFGPSWKTAACGVIAAAGVACMQSTDPTIHTIGLACTVFGLAGNGIAGKDSDVSHSLTGSASNVAAEIAPLLTKLAAVDPETISPPLAVTGIAEKTVIIEPAKPPNPPPHHTQL